MITLFVLPSSTSSRKAQKHLMELGVPFMVRNLKYDPFTFEELKTILSLTEEGTDEIIARGMHKFMEDQGIELDDLSLAQLHQLSIQHPRLFRAPIAIDRERMVIGYEEGRYDVFKSRKARIQEYQVYLEDLRREEDIRIQKKLEEEAALAEEEFEMAGIL